MTVSNKQKKPWLLISQTPNSKWKIRSYLTFLSETSHGPFFFFFFLPEGPSYICLPFVLLLASFWLPFSFLPLASKNYFRITTMLGVEMTTPLHRKARKDSQRRLKGFWEARNEKLKANCTKLRWCFDWVLRLVVGLKRYFCCIAALL